MSETIIVPPDSNPEQKKLKPHTSIVVFGASGDLAKKKTFPALFGLHRNGFLPSQVHIVGYARTVMNQEQFHKRISSYIKIFSDHDQEQLNEFLSFCQYVHGPYDKPEGFIKLNQCLEKIESDKAHDRLFYMALPPSVFIVVSENTKKYAYPKDGSSTARIIIEKPFGHDLESSRKLEEALKPNWSEDEIFRIDHYLGKEMVKNILILRFGNEFARATWSKEHIANVQITFKEPFGTEGRGGYFNDIGIIRDVMQNHLLQILTMVAMERPASFAAEDIRDEKVRVLKAMRPIELKDALIGQYTKSADGTKPGYTDDPGVPDDSRTVTFAALTAYVHNDRWDGVPFVLRAGKALNEHKAEIRIQFRDVTRGIFKNIPRNELVIRLQPNEAIYLKMNSKLPGLSMKTVVTELDLTYRRRFSDLRIPEAYEALILDALNGDHSNFVRDDELDLSWKVFTPLLHKLDEDKSLKPAPYAYGTRGPKELADFLSRYNYVFSEQGYQWSGDDDTDDDLHLQKSKPKA